MEAGRLAESSAYVAATFATAATRQQKSGKRLPVSRQEGLVAPSFLVAVDVYPPSGRIFIRRILFPRDDAIHGEENGDRGDRIASRAGVESARKDLFLL